MRRLQAVEKDWILRNRIENFITKEVKELTFNQASQLVELIRGGSEAAYISRYRSDVHGGLAPDKIRKVIDAYFDAVNLNRKVHSALTTITPKVVGASEKKEVTERLVDCESTEEVDEIAREFSTGTKKTKAKIAKELGLEPAAHDILAGKFVDLKLYLSNDLKNLCAVEKHLNICLADMINRDSEVRSAALKIVKLETKCDIQILPSLSRDATKNKEDLETRGILKKYNDYIGNEWKAWSIKDHNVSALNRGTEEGLISWKAKFNKKKAKENHPFSNKIGLVNNGMRTVFKNALNYSIDNYFIPMVERGIKKYLSRRAACRSIQIFGHNVEQLFCQEGVRSKYVIALDPGTVVKAAFLEPSGNVIAMDEFFIRNSEFNHYGSDILKNWSSRTNGKDLVFAIGNGSNTYNTQSAVSRMIAHNEFPESIDVCFCVVPEHGASKYSCTEAAREEFGEEAEIKQVSAVSIGRRLIDPMSEYVKIEPQHLGKVQYQLSIDEKLLKEKLVAVVRDRVSLIGADLNVASKSLLQSICGLNASTASEIVKYREKHGRFKSRNELKRVRGIGEVTFQQCAGFLTVCRPEGITGPPLKRMKSELNSLEWSPLDETIVHPDDYAVATKLLEKLEVEDIAKMTSILEMFATRLSVEERKILELLISKPDLKPPPTMMKKVLAMKDLSIGQKYTGTVSNKTDFGIFVDIGVETEGLVHISQYHGAQVQTGKPASIVDHLIPSVGEHIEVVIKSFENNKISLEIPRNRN